MLKVAEAREKQAITVLGEAQSRLQSDIARLEELQHYQQEYRQQLQLSGSIGMDARRMVDYQNFLDKLKLAIEQQQSIISVSSRLVEEKRQLWFDTRNKLKSYGNVMSRYQTEELMQEDKREQQETDERAGNAGYRRTDEKQDR